MKNFKKFFWGGFLVGVLALVSFSTVRAETETCGLGLVSSPNGYASVFQGESSAYVLQYTGSDNPTLFVRTTQNIDGVSFSISPVSPKNGDTVKINVVASPNAKIKSYYKSGQFDSEPIVYGCQIGNVKNEYGVSFAVIDRPDMTPTPLNSCSIPSVILPPNSSALLGVGTNSITTGELSITGFSSGKDISVSPVFPNIKFGMGGLGTGGLQTGREVPSVIVKTGPNFSGGTYSVTSDVSGSKCTATGAALLPTVSNSSGKVKLSQVEYLSDTMFPKSECPLNVKGCRAEFYSGGSGPKIVSVSGAPALIGGDRKALNPAPAKGGSTTIRLFSLSNPMNPSRVDSMTGLTITEQDDAFGDFGPALSMSSVAYSKDGKYKAATSSQGWLFVSTPQAGKIRVTRDVHGDISIVKHDGEYVLVYDRGAINITKSKDFERYETEYHEPLPEGFPDFEKRNYGSKLLLTDDSYIAVIPNSNLSSLNNEVSSLKIFKVGQEDPVATLATEFGGLKYGKISFSGGDYIYVLDTKYTGSGYNSVAQSSLDVFKFEYSTNKLTKITSGLKLPTNDVVDAVAPFDFGSGNAGLITFVRVKKSSNQNYVYGDYEGRIRAYLLSDLMSGKVVDTLTNSPVSTSSETQPLGSIILGAKEIFANSFSKDGITYVYTTSSFGTNLKVWKFELNSGVSDFKTKDPLPPQTNPKGTVGCLGGAVYETSMGKLCVNSSSGVTTMTSFNFDTTVLPAPPAPGCSDGYTYSISTGEKCLYTSSTSIVNNGSEKNVEFLGPPVYNLGTTTLKNGSAGEAVKELQRFLNDKLNLGLVVDGKLGPKTILVIKKWQSDNGLVPDGLVGPKTKMLMNSGL